LEPWAPSRLSQRIKVEVNEDYRQRSVIDYLEEAERRCIAVSDLSNIQQAITMGRRWAFTLSIAPAAAITAVFALFDLHVYQGGMNAFFSMKITSVEKISHRASSIIEEAKLTTRASALTKRVKLTA
jgi:hypothetical protein